MHHCSPKFCGRVVMPDLLSCVGGLLLAPPYACPRSRGHAVLNIVDHKRRTGCNSGHLDREV